MLSILNYKIENEIGRGATSIVYKVTQDGKIYALKIMEAATSAEAMASAVRFRREAAIVARLKHSSLVNVHSVGEQDGRPFLVMDLVQGQSLSKLIKKSAISEELVLKIAKSVAGALAVAHRNGLIHRDIKPDNILLDDQEHVYLIDFGFADEAVDVNDAVVGTFLYSPSEQSGMLKRPVDGRSDLYSLGAVLYECLTGTPVFTSNSALELLKQHAVTPAPDVRVLKPSVRPIIAMIISKMLNKDPDDRYQTAESLVHDLERVANLEIELRNGEARLDQKGSQLRSQFELPFVGREKELNTLKMTWEKVSKGNVTLVQLEGEGGAGKTRLTQELLSFASKSKIILLKSKCQDNDTVPLGPIREAIDNYILDILKPSNPSGKSDLEFLRRAGGDHGSILRNLSKGLAQVFKKDSGESTVSQDEFYDTVADFLANMTKEGHQLLILLDDTQWIDVTSTTVLSRLIKKSTELPIFILTTARNDAASAAASRHFFEFVSSGKGTQIVLEPFDSTAVAKYCSAFLAGGTLENSAVEKLQSVSNGNVFALNEYLRSLLDTGAIAPNEGKWTVDMEQLAKLALSPNVIPLIINRLKKLSLESLDLLKTASLAGIQFNKQFLIQATQKSSNEITSLLEEATFANLIEAHEDNDFTIVHDRVREALIEDIPSGERKDRHYQLAAAMLKNEDQTADYYFGLAQHLMNGHPEKNPQTVFEICLKAGKLALESFSNAQAYSVLMNGYSARDMARASGHASDSSTLLDEMLATAAYRTVRLDEAHRHLNTCIQSFKSNDDLRRAYLLQAMTFVAEGKFDNAWSSIERTLKLLGRPVPEKRISLFVSIVWFWISGRILERSRFLRKVLNFKSNEERAMISRMGAIENQVCFMRGRLDLSVYFASKNYVNALLLGPSSELALSTSFNSYGHGLFQKYVFRVPKFLEYYSVAQKKEIVRFYGQNAINIAEQAGDANMVSICIYNLGNTIQYAGDTIMSENLIRQALIRNKKVSNYTLCGVNIMILSWLLESRGLSRELIDLVETEQDAILKCNNVFYQTVAYGLSYVALNLQGRGREANNMRIRALEAANKYPPFPWLQASLIIFEIAVALDNREIGSEVDTLINQFLDMKFRNAYCNHVYALIAHIRYLQFVNKKISSPEYVNLHEAMKDLEHFGNNPVLECHYWILKAAMNRRDHQYALKVLQRAHEMASESDSKWGLYEVALGQAAVYQVIGDQARSNICAQAAIDIANSQGWKNRAKNVMTEFKLTEPIDLTQQSNSNVGKSSTKSLVAERYVDSLLRISLASSSTLDPVMQCKAALDELINILNAERGLFFLCDINDEKKLILSAGRDGNNEIQDIKGYSTTVVSKVRETRQPLIVSGTDHGEILGAQSVVAHNLRSIIAAPIMYKEKFLGVIYLDSRVAKGIFSEEDLKIFAAISNHIGIAIEIARIATVESEAKVLELDMALTGAVQTYFLPEKDTHVGKGLKICGYYRPCSKAGGDWWWYNEDKEGTLSILVGDVTGHGAASAMLTASTAAQMRNVARSNPILDIPEVMRELNEGFHHFAKGNFFMTMSAVSMSWADKKLRWWTAGAPPIMILKKGAQSHLESEAGNPLGLEPFSLGYTEVELAAGDRVFVFTDGLTELELPGGSQLRMRQVHKILDNTSNLPLEEAREHIVKQVEKLQQGVPLRDDLTFVLVDVL